MTRTYYSVLFAVAALFNIANAILWFLMPRQSLQLFGLPSDTNTLFLHLFSGLVAVFGVGYYRISKNLEKGQEIALLGAMGKMSVVVVVFFYFMQGQASSVIIAPVCLDFLFAMAFIEYYRKSRFKLIPAE